MEQQSTINAEIIGKVYTETRTDVFAIFRQARIPEEQCWDMVQDVFMKLMKIDLIDGERVRGMIFTIAFRMRTDYYRHRYFVNKIFSENPDATSMDHLYNNNTLEVKELERFEMKIVSRMSELDSKTYCMDRFEEKSSKEIAMQLNLSSRSIEARLYRTRKTVRENMRKVVNGI